MKEPRFYLAVFGNPMLPGHVTVEEGHFGVHAGWPESIAPGDLVLLYCTGGYARYPKSVPGVGVVEEVDYGQQSFTFDYEPLSQPVPLEALRFVFEPVDAAKLRNIRFNNHWLFEIAAESFGRAVYGLLG